MKRSSLLISSVMTCLIANAVFFVVADPEGSALRLAGFLIPVVAGCFAVAGMASAVRGLRILDTAKLAWLLLCLGMGLWLLGEITYGLLGTIGGVDVDSAETTFADLFWLAGYLPLLVGLLILLRGYRQSRFPKGRLVVYLLLAAAVVVGAVFLAVRLFAPIVADTETSIVGKVAYLFYPAADLPLIFLAAVLFYITSLLKGSRLSTAWQWMALGFLLMTFSDVAYSYLSWNEAYSPGSLIDLGWNGGYLCIGLAGFLQRELIDSFGRGS